MDFRNNETDQQSALMENTQEHDASNNLNISAPEISLSLDSLATPPPELLGTDASTIIAGKLSILEDHLKSIGKILNQHIEKEEMVTRSLVEIESKINKIQKSLIDRRKSTAPSQTTSDTSVTDRINSATEAVHSDEMDNPLQKYEMGSSTVAVKEIPSEKWQFSGDFASMGLSYSEENKDFVSEPTDDFTASPEKDFFQNDDAYPYGRERKKLLLIVVPFFMLLAFFLFLVYYYTDMRKPADTKLIITEQISVSPRSVDTAPSEPALATAVQTEPEKDSSIALASSSMQVPTAEIKEAVISINATSETSGTTSPKFTVSVGSFKEKRNALDLTAKLSQKGYSVKLKQLPQTKLFRVTVGAFSSRNEALVMASRLHQKEQLQTAIIDLSQP